MSRLKLRCAAKINLSLDVTGKRPDGYHNIESIFQSVSIYDELELTVTEGEGISLTCSGNDEVPCDERNIAWKHPAGRRRSPSISTNTSPPVPAWAAVRRMQRACSPV